MVGESFYDDTMSFTKAQKKRLNRHLTEMGAIAAVIIIVWVLVTFLKANGL